MMDGVSKRREEAAGCGGGGRRWWRTRLKEIAKETRTEENREVKESM